MANCDVKWVFDIMIVYLYKGISADKNALVTFFTKSVLLLLKNVCKVCRISSLDLLSNSFWCLDVFPLLSRKRLLQETVQLQK